MQRDCSSTRQSLEIQLLVLDRSAFAAESELEVTMLICLLAQLMSMNLETAGEEGVSQQVKEGGRAKVMGGAKSYMMGTR